ncbi:hypothetical protein CVT26_007106 [Gymnopilus dilepis]|uniref:Uncharacterized protein n=1 Tax=Gymnopilus dilepis TaxID=231916 RepID=A0A409X0V2_9AGAR|nr:hypothetical protein CVT26_007106 [Gymnopilus dilepis]
MSATSTTHARPLTPRLPSFLTIFFLLFLSLSFVSAAPMPLTPTDSLHLLTDTVDTLSLGSGPLPLAALAPDVDVIPGSPLSGLNLIPSSTVNSNLNSNLESSSRARARANERNAKPATLLGRIYRPAVNMDMNLDTDANVAQRLSASSGGPDDGESTEPKEVLTRAERFQRRVGRIGFRNLDE